MFHTSVCACNSAGDDVVEHVQSQKRYPTSPKGCKGCTSGKAFRRQGLGGIPTCPPPPGPWPAYGPLSWAQVPCSAKLVNDKDAVLASMLHAVRITISRHYQVQQLDQPTCRS